MFSGDTAQTIAKGVDFRFSDVQSVFYDEFFSSSQSDGVRKKGRLSEIFHLCQNLRTHVGIFKLAQSVIDIYFRFFFPFQSRCFASREKGEPPFCFAAPP